MRWLDWLPIGRVPQIAPEDLSRRLAEPDPPVVIDVRTAIEFHRGHIPGARHVPVQALGASLPTLALQSGATVVAVCKTAHRSIPAVRLLRNEGLTALQLAGGMDRWRRHGLPVVQGDPS
jgi:rhodanese-related sulfurtransferase